MAGRGGRGHPTALDFVHGLIRDGLNEEGVREQLRDRCYTPQSISQLLRSARERGFWTPRAEPAVPDVVWPAVGAPEPPADRMMLPVAIPEEEGEFFWPYGDLEGEPDVACTGYAVDGALAPCIFHGARPGQPAPATRDGTCLWCDPERLMSACEDVMQRPVLVEWLLGFYALHPGIAEAATMRLTGVGGVQVVLDFLRAVPMPGRAEPDSEEDDGAASADDAADDIVGDEDMPAAGTDAASADGTGVLPLRRRIRGKQTIPGIAPPPPPPSPPIPDDSSEEFHDDADDEDEFQGSEAESSSDDADVLRRALTDSENTPPEEDLPSSASENSDEDEAPIVFAATDDAPAADAFVADADDAWMEEAAPKRRRIRGKQSVPDYPVATATVLARAAAPIYVSNLCKGETCKFSRDFPGHRAAIHGGTRRCMWCQEDGLKDALETKGGERNVMRCLRAFWNHDRSIFDDAVGRLPAEHREFLPLRALGLPKVFHNKDALATALTTNVKRGPILQMLRKVRTENPDIYPLVLAILPEARKVELDEAARTDPRKARRELQTAAREARRRELGPEAWPAVVSYRRRALRESTEDEIAEYQERRDADKHHARGRFFPKRASTWKTYRDVELPPHCQGEHAPVADRLPELADCDETGLPNVSNMDAAAQRFQEWCRFGSWTACAQCHRLEKRKLFPVDMRSAAPAEIKKCRHCAKGTGYAVKQPDDRPEPLRELTENIVQALRPLSTDPGPHVRAQQGYRVHTAMTRLVWEEKPVKEKIRELPSGRDRKKARRALRYLRAHDDNAYNKWYKDQKKFLRLNAAMRAEDDKEQSDDNDLSAIPTQKRRLPLNTIEAVGIECAVWPHLYWTTEMCETAVRAGDIRRQATAGARRAALSESEGSDGEAEVRAELPKGSAPAPAPEEEAMARDSGDEDKEAGEDAIEDDPERREGRQSMKGSFVAKVLGPIIGYGTDYKLMQFVYDLHMWTMLGSKRNLRKTGTVPLRILLRGASFSPLYWRLRHNALLDLQRQLGYPTLFYTFSPYEWSFPYHTWMLDEMEKDLRERLHLPAGESFHLAHVLLELAQGYLMGTSGNTSQVSKTWSQHILKDEENQRVVVNFAARLEFQDGKRKQTPKHDYDAGGKGDRNFGRGAVHLHLLVWLRDGDVHCLKDTLRGTVPEGDPIMAGYVLGSQPCWGESNWPERKEPTAVSEDKEELFLQHLEVDELNGLRAFFWAITQATRGSHQDALLADKQGLLLKYVASYLPKFSDDFANEFLDEECSAFRIASKVLFDYHPQEPDMWLQLAAKHFPVWKMGGSTISILAPYYGMEKKPDFVARYEACTWKGKEMTLLEYLRKANDKNKPMRYIVEAFRAERNLRRGDGIDEEELGVFARDFRTEGQKLVAVDTVWRLNDRFYGQWLALHVPFQKLEDLADREVEARVPARYYHLAAAMQRRPDYWREADLGRATADMKLEALNRTQVETVTAMIRARGHLIDEYMAGRLRRDDVAVEGEGPGASAAGESVDFKYDGAQELFVNLAKKHIDRTLLLQTTENVKEAEELAEKCQRFRKPIAVLGPPGSGKTARAKELVRYTRGKDGRVLFAFPTGQMQSRLRHELQSEGLDVDVDTCHGAFVLHKPEQEALAATAVLQEFALILVDEFPQMSKHNFERIVHAWENVGKAPVLVFLGDFHQLPSIEGTNAKDSALWKHVCKIRFHRSYRCDADASLHSKLQQMRKQIPKRSVRNSILRGHKAWNQEGGPTADDLRKLFRDTDGKTTIVTCTKRAAQSVNELAAEVLVGKRAIWVSLPADYEVNAENYGEDGKLRTDRRPMPSMIHIRKGLRVHLTRNCDKEGDFVNGMEATVQGWDARSQCLHVKTVTGKAVAVFRYTDPSPQAQNTSYFPVRLGYASTIYKMQGAELPHVTIYLDVPGQRAAAYVALSRVRRCDDYLFGGKVTRQHFVPNA